MNQLNYFMFSSMSFPKTKFFFLLNIQKVYCTQILSSVFEKHRRTEIGLLQFPISLFSPALNIGVTRPIFRSFGKISFFRDKLHTCIKGFSKGSKRFLTKLTLMLSQPELLLILSRKNSLTDNGRFGYTLSHFLKKRLNFQNMFQLFLQGLFQFASSGVLEVSVSSRPVSYNNFLK